MNFNPSDEQQLLTDSLQRLLQDHYAFDQRRAIAASEHGTSPACWSQLARMGITGLGIPESYGGIGGGNVDRLPVHQCFGRYLVQEPYLASVVLGATAIRGAADEGQRERLLHGVASGELQLAWAHDEEAVGHDTSWTETRARLTEGASRTWRLDGVKNPVLHAGSAHCIIVTARVAGEPGDEAGLALFAIDPRADGVSMRRYRLIDDTPAAQLRIASAIAEPLGDPYDCSRALATIRKSHAAGTAAACNDMVGAMECAFSLTQSYLNTRKQFGRPIGQYQALRHKLAEMQVSLEVSRSMAIAAAFAADEANRDGGAADLARAKLVIGRHARALCECAVQSHGGIGMTEEYAVGHTLRRVHVLDQMFGDSDAQAAWLATGRP